jgi:hypothetical protein
MLSIPFLLKKETMETQQPLPVMREETPAAAAPEANDRQPQPVIAEAKTGAIQAAAPETGQGQTEQPLPVAQASPLPPAGEEEKQSPIPSVAAFAGPEREPGTTSPHLIAGLPAKARQTHSWIFGLSAKSHTEVFPDAGGKYDYELYAPEVASPVETDENAYNGKDEPLPEQSELPNNPDWKEYSPGEHTIAYRHRIPLSFNLSAGKKLSNRFALESGLSYTYLFADISLTTEIPGAGYSGKQQLHYLGIPVKANWWFYERGRWAAYLSAGTLFEYCISASRQWGGVNTTPDLNRFQASLTAAAGLQMELIHNISLFAEPGIGYYFDNGNGSESVYFDRPLVFNLRAGLRFTY